MPEFQRLRAAHAPAVLAFELANRAYFTAFISDRGDDFFDHFTERHDALLAEQEVLALLADGLPDREISRRLFISERTVHHHVSAVLAKVGVSSRTAAAREAARLGIAP